MPRIRIAVAVLAGLLLAGACGGDELGNRFEWCGELQQELDWNEDAVARMQSAEVAVTEAEAAYAAATDELDKIEVRDALVEAERSYNGAVSDLRSLPDGRPRLYHLFTRIAALVVYGERPIARSEPYAVAAPRAWEALVQHLPAQIVEDVVLHAEQQVAYIHSRPNMDNTELDALSVDILRDIGNESLGVGPFPPSIAKLERVIEIWTNKRQAHEEAETTFEAATGMTSRDYFASGSKRFEKERIALKNANITARNIFRQEIYPILVSAASAYQAQQQAIQSNGEAALPKIISDTTAYTAFKESFAESCRE